ncbi:hypothetical protein [Azospirillum sp. ST 5-10]|uniref:hypothetical protein n=1 Tax=unclassified Azospirillum TaxID=2630922 RepID=UPI003F49C89A
MAALKAKPGRRTSRSWRAVHEKRQDHAADVVSMAGQHRIMGAFTTNTGQWITAAA